MKLVVGGKEVKDNDLIDDGYNVEIYDLEDKNGKDDDEILDGGVDNYENGILDDEIKIGDDEKEKGEKLYVGEKV